jgi:magnesium-transporting ATPase (P-type)
LQPNEPLFTSKGEIKINYSLKKIKIMEGVMVIFGIFIAPIVMVIFIVWLKNKERMKRYELQAELYTKALEKGETLPSDLFTEQPQIRNSNLLKTGFTCIAVGVGTMVSAVVFAATFLYFDPGWFNMVWMVPTAMLGAVAIIPILIGVAFMIIHFIEKKKARKNAE